MSKTIKIEIPTDFTIEHYTKLGQMEHLREVEKIIRIISSVSNYDEKEISSWDIKSIKTIYEDIKDVFENLDPVFLPIFTYKGIEYGIQPISKMTGGEYIDLEKSLEKENILDVMSIIYRPITESKFDSTWWKIKGGIKYVAGRADDLFRYYKVEEYDTEKRDWRKDIFKDIPVSIALGAYNFFLLVAIQLSNSILLSSEQVGEKEKKMLENQMVNLFKNISDGFTLSTDLQKTGES